jgi:radical SAM superfamily enzyme YgiQ (UPF0313 family)
MRILYSPNYKSQQRQFEKKNYNPYPVLMAMEAEWYRKQGHEVEWGFPASHLPKYYDKIIGEPENLPFLSLPRPDRVFTSAKEYISGNYKYLPGTHMQAANGCWHGKCSFCVENGSKYEVRPVDDCIAEIEECKALGFREVFDDSGTFPTGRWLDEFIYRMGKNSFCNCSFGANLRISDYPFHDMRRVGFRMVLFGIESANEKTLERINKGVKVEDIIPTIKQASEAGLEPHIAVMFGYPWETDADALRTLNLVHYLLKKGYAKTAQASFFTQQGFKGNEKHRKYVKQIYNVGFSPEFWFNKLRDIKNIEDIKYIWKGIKSWLGK